MAKIIKIQQHHIDAVVEAFREALNSQRFSDGVVSFSKNFTPDDVKRERAELIFSDMAWAKIKLLVASNDKEVGWHGLADKNCQGSYRVDDIMVYPQTVTGATVETDQLQYDQWKFELSDEEFARLKFHGHSHVNMAVSPSGTDTANQRAWLDALGDDGFYIFLIINKRGEMWARIYDLEDNVLYEKNDIDIVEGETLGDWLDESETLVEEKKFTTPTASKYTPVTVTKSTSTSSKKEKKKERENYSSLYSQVQEEEILAAMYGRGNYRDPFYYE